MHTFKRCHYNQVNKGSSLCILVCGIIFTLVLKAEATTVTVFDYDVFICENGFVHEKEFALIPPPQSQV